MSVYRRGETYWYEFRVNGSRFRGSTGETNREDAKAAEARARLAAKRGLKRGERPDITLNASAEKYFQEIGRHLATAKTIDAQLEHLVRLIGGAVTLAEIDDAAVADYILRRRAEKSRNAPRDHKKSCRCERCALAPATINREIELLRRLMIRAGRAWKTRMGEPPDWSTHRLPEPAERVRELSADEESALIQSLRPDFRALILFCLATGVRRNDAITLTWRQVDFAAGVIRFTTKSAKPGGQPHTIPLTGAVAAIIQGERGHNPIRVFTYICQKSRAKRRMGQRYPFSTSGWSRDWREALTAAGIDDFRFHDLRHTAATRLLRASGNLRLVQRLLGHADITTTARYAHADLADLRAAMEAAAPRQVPTKLPTAKNLKSGKA